MERVCKRNKIGGVINRLNVWTRLDFFSGFKISFRIVSLTFWRNEILYETDKNFDSNLNNRRIFMSKINIVVTLEICFMFYVFI